MRRYAWLAVTCALAPLPAFADGGCVDLVLAAPAHPASTDRVALRAQLAVPAGRAVLARAVRRGSAIELEVVVTDEPQLLPAYRRVGDPALDALAFVGPLDAGSYTITTTTRSIAAGIETRCPASRSDLVIARTPAPVVFVDVIEYYDTVGRRHFMTADAREIADLDASPTRWVRTGGGFKAYALYESDNRAEAVCRYERAGGTVRDGYMLSATYRECAALAANGAWRYDSRAFDIVHPDTLSGACPAGTRAVYRVWDLGSGDHRWTTDAVLRASLVAHGWVSEGYGSLGVAMCAPT